MGPSNRTTLISCQPPSVFSQVVTVRYVAINSIRYHRANPDGDAVGGRYLEVTSLEYNYRFAERWSAATFIDAGRAFNNFDTAYSVGAGVGIRWQSPVGPFRLDIAEPVDDERFNNIRFHISLGPEL